MESGLKYRSDIDGLRGVAVLAVVFFHAGIGLSGGYVGVDVFFVISGFLITSLIKRDIDQGQFSYVQFWERRARRLVPALFATVLVTMIGGWFLLLPHDFQELGQSSVAQSVGLANFYFWRESGYFAGDSEVKPLLHMWSLAVEEQFYFVMPGLMLLIHRVSRRAMLPALVVLAVISLWWSIYSTTRLPESAFYLLPARAWELMLGAIVALLTVRWNPKRQLAEAMGWLGLGLVAYGCYFFDNRTPFPGWHAALPCLGAALLIWGNAGCNTLTGVCLQIPVLAFIGRISYSLYLLHWPLMAFQRYFEGAGREGLPMPVLVTVAFLLATVSWKYVEQPFRKRQCCSGRAAMLLTAVSGLAFCFFLGLFVHRAQGVRGRFSEEVLRLADGRGDRNRKRNLTHDVPISLLRETGLPRLDASDQSPVLAIIGDSHADAVIPVLRELCRKHSVPAVAVTGSATVPLVLATTGESYKDRYREEIFAALDRLPDLREVFLIARWTRYPGQMTSENLERTLAFLQRRECRVWLLRQVPEAPFDVPRSLALNGQWNSARTVFGIGKAEYLASRKQTDLLFLDRANDQFNLLDPISIFFAERENGLLSRDGRPFYFDDDHLSVHGARELIPLFERVLSAARIWDRRL